MRRTNCTCEGQAALGQATLLRAIISFAQICLDAGMCGEVTAGAEQLLATATILELRSVLSTAGNLLIRTDMPYFANGAMKKSASSKLASDCAVHTDLHVLRRRDYSRHSGCGRPCRGPNPLPSHEVKGCHEDTRSSSICRRLPRQRVGHARGTVRPDARVHDGRLRVLCRAHAHHRSADVGVCDLD